MSAILISLDGALGDTRPLWNDWLAGAAGVLGVDPATLSADRGAAAAELDAAGAGNWRTLLERFTAERAPVYLRPNATASSALRGLAAAGRPIGVFTDAPIELAATALSQLGAARRVTVTATGTGALEALRDKLGGDAVVVTTRSELTALAAGDQEASR